MDTEYVSVKPTMTILISIIFNSAVFVANMYYEYRLKYKLVY